MPLKPLVIRLVDTKPHAYKTDESWISLPFPNRGS